MRGRLIDTLRPVCTQEDVARELGISRERARQIEVRALRKLRQALAARGYCAADFLDGASEQRAERGR